MLAQSHEFTTLAGTCCVSQMPSEEFLEQLHGMLIHGVHDAGYSVPRNHSCKNFLRTWRNDGPWAGTAKRQFPCNCPSRPRRYSVLISKEPSEPWQVWTCTPTDAAILYRTLVRDQALHRVTKGPASSETADTTRGDEQRAGSFGSPRTGEEVANTGEEVRDSEGTVLSCGIENLPRGSCHAFSGRSTSTETEDAARVRWVTWQISWPCPPLPWETFPGRSQEALPC